MAKSVSSNTLLSRTQPFGSMQNKKVPLKSMGPPMRPNFGNKPRRG